MKIHPFTATCLFLLLGWSLLVPLGAQNLILNPDFNQGLEHWTITGGTVLESSEEDTVAFLSKENGVLYQKVTGIEPGKTYRCTIRVTDILVKQTTGYGYAIEKSNPVEFPEFTIGASQMDDVCLNNGGIWIQPPIETTGPQDFVYDFTVPEGSTSVYICIATKGALARISVTSVSLREAPAMEVLFSVRDRQTGLPLEGAEIRIRGISGTFLTGADGKAPVGLVPSPDPYPVNVERNWYRAFSGEIPVSDTTTAFLVELDSIEEVKQVVTRISKYGDNDTPYPLFGHVWSSGLSYNQEEVGLLAGSLDYIIGGAGLTADPQKVDALHAADPDFQVINYKGGWKVNRAEGENNKMDLVYYKCGSLASGIDAGATSVVINAPLKGGGVLASEPDRFNVWIRIREELMKVIAVSSFTSYPITLTVERGMDGTFPRSYDAGTTVTLPLYNSPPVPGESGSNIAYQSSVYGTRWRDLDKELMEAAAQKHYDGIWIDILIGRLGAMSILGGNYEEWDHRTETSMSSAMDVEYTKKALDSLYLKFYSRMGYYPVIYGNNVLYSQSLDRGSRAWLMAEETPYKRVLDGFCHENSWGHVQSDDSGIDHEGQVELTGGSIREYGSDNRYLLWHIGDNWQDNCKAIALLAQEGLPGQPMTINAGFKNQWFAESFPDDSRYRFNRYCYASYLLCVQAEADSSISCRMGISPMRVKGGLTYLEIEPYFYHDIGLPLENRPWNGFSGYRHGSHNLYSRTFSDGLVLLNPFARGMGAPVKISDITGDNRVYVDPERDSMVVTSVQLDSLQSMILLHDENAEPVSTPALPGSPSFKLFPNPAGNVLHISQQAPEGSGNHRFRICHMNGMLLREINAGKNGNTAVDISGLTPGIYSIRHLETGEVRKFVKQ